MICNKQINETATFEIAVITSASWRELKHYKDEIIKYSDRLSDIKKSHMFKRRKQEKILMKNLMIG